MSTLLIDTVSLYHCVKKRHSGGRIDYRKFVDEAEDIWGPFKTQIAYVSAINDRSQDFMWALQQQGLFVKQKRPTVVYVNGKEFQKTVWDVELAIDAMEHANDKENMVICSSRLAILPLLQRLNKRTACTAIYASAIPRIFKEQAFIKEVGANILNDTFNSAE